VESIGESWRPILTGDDAERAAQAIRDIEVSLRALYETESRSSVHGVPEFSLAFGAAGVALLFVTLASIRGCGSDTSTGEAVLSHSIAGAEIHARSVGLYHGLAGVGWVIQRALALSDEVDAEDPNASIDEALTAWLIHPIARTECDVISGLVGVGVYSIGRPNQPAAKTCLQLILSNLAACAPPVGELWQGLLAAGYARRYSHRNYQNALGLAHGVAGIASFLARAFVSGYDDSETEDLIRRSVTWLVDHTPASDHSDRSIHGRLSWCWGDLGVALAILRVSQALSESDIENHALGLARSCAVVEPLDAFPDACLCHGTAGTGHLFNRLYQSTGDEIFRLAAIKWLQRTLDMRRGKEGIGGYSFVSDIDGDASRAPTPGFLRGASGVALALSAGISSLEPEWDQPLLVDVPTRQIRIARHV